MSFLKDIHLLTKKITKNFFWRVPFFFCDFFLNFRLKSQFWNLNFSEISKLFFSWTEQLHKYFWVWGSKGTLFWSNSTWNTWNQDWPFDLRGPKTRRNWKKSGLDPTLGSIILPWHGKHRLFILFPCRTNLVLHLKGQKSLCPCCPTEFLTCVYRKIMKNVKITIFDCDFF